MEVDGCRPMRAMDGWVFDGLWSCGGFKNLGHLVASVAVSFPCGVAKEILDV